MEETPKPRRTLSLKGGVVPAALEALHAPAPESREVWKCKPCGATVELDGLEAGATVRCGNCGARLGLLEQFTDGTEKQPRARKATLAPPPPAKPVVPEIKTRPRRT